ncbi:MAG: tryptophan synthase subunit beta [Spirochaetae bacterium HGW-Spirochaetae-5]|nr:MAG: tryptophan synthase subunit beta [Spirochaetae bacterium HGW-Spirochaetae-5]
MTSLPDTKGYFGKYGGRFVPETLIKTLKEIEDGYASFAADEAEQKKLKKMLSTYAGRPTPVYHAERLSERHGVNIYFKREDLVHTGSHKLNNALGQALLAKYMGKTRIIAETGAGQHGVATATCAALLGLECEVFMGSVDVARQSPNVKRMKLLGTKVTPVESGSKTLKDAINAAMKDWVRTVQNTYYLLGSVVGPHPFPVMVRNFQSVISEEAIPQFRDVAGCDPDFVIACVGGGSNAAGIFAHYKNIPGVKLIGIEAGGRSSKDGDHSAKLNYGRPGIMHGNHTYVLQTKEGNVMPVHSISAGLDYPSVGAEHSHFHDSGIAAYHTCSDTEALSAFKELSLCEGIIPALESSHALGYLLTNSEKYKGKNVLINLSGRGDKDMPIIEEELGL